MSEFKGTPGPWEVIESQHEGLVVIQKESLEEGQGWIGYTSIASDLQGEDDANLIAAAPELLEELKETHAALCFTPDYIGSERYKRNKSAIDKALGQ